MSTPATNPYNFFVDAVIGSLTGNIGTIFAHNQTLEVWTSTNAALTNNWTTGTNSTLATLETNLGNVVSDSTSSPPIPTGNTSPNNAMTMQAFINDTFTNVQTLQNTPIYDLTNQFITSVMQKLGSSSIYDSTT